MEREGSSAPLPILFDSLHGPRQQRSRVLEDHIPRIHPAVRATSGLSVIVPTYNEVENIPDLIAEIDRLLQTLAIPGEILIVDDGSPDGTAEKARGVRTASELRVIVRRDHRDLSTAILEGFRQARHDVLIVCDADFSHPVEKIPELAQPILEDRADMVIGSRYTAGGQVDGWSWRRKLFSRTAKLFARPLVTVKDPMSGFFAVRKRILGNTPFRPEGYKMGLELLVRLNLKNVVEVPILFQDRRHGVSKLGSGMVLASLRHLWRLMAFQLGLPGNRVSRWILGVVLGLTSILHLVMALSVGLIPEEAYHWNYAQHLDWSYFDHPPMVGWMIWLGSLVLGDNRAGVRIPAVLASCVTTWLIYRITRLISVTGQKGRNGLIALLLYSALPYFWVLGFISLPDTFLSLFWAAAVYWLLKVLQGGRASDWYGAGLFLGLAMLSKYTAIFLAGGVLLFLACSERHRPWLLRREPYLAGLLALAVFSPVLLWNLRHGWVSFQFQTIQRAEEFSPISAERFLAFLFTQALAFWPPAFLLMEYEAGRRWRALLTGEPAEASLLLWSFLPIFFVFAWVGLQTEVHIAWPAPAYLGLVPLTATTIGATRRQGERGRLWRGGSLALLFFPLILYPLAAFYLPAFGVPLRGSAKALTAWEELSRRVAAEEAFLPRGRSFIFAGGRYQIASQIAFYLKAPERVYSQNVIGMNGVSFNDWSDLRPLVGKDAIFVADNTEAYTSGLLRKYFNRVGPPEAVTIRKAQTLLATFFLVRCYGYKGSTPVR